jgi:hypothetical protein
LHLNRKFHHLRARNLYEFDDNIKSLLEELDINSLEINSFVNSLF